MQPLKFRPFPAELTLPSSLQHPITVILLLALSITRPLAPRAVHDHKVVVTRPREILRTRRHHWHYSASSAVVHPEGTTTIIRPCLIPYLPLRPRHGDEDGSRGGSRIVECGPAPAGIYGLDDTKDSSARRSYPPVSPPTHPRVPVVPANLPNNLAAGPSMMRVEDLPGECRGRADCERCTTSR